MKLSGLFLTLFLTTSFAFAQEIPDELYPDEQGTSELEASPLVFGDGSKSVGASRVNLRLFCPPPRSQAGLPAGARLGLAFGYGAMTILKAKQQNWTPAQVQREAFSAYFPFELLPKDAARCSTGNEYIRMLNTVLTQTGNLKAAVYDNASTDCLRKPSNAQKEQARRHCIDRLRRVFDTKDSDAAKRYNTQQYIQGGRPVVVMLQTDAGFNKLRTDTWVPNNQQLIGKTTYQPVVVVGFDNTRQAFELLNSMGTGWGKGGFAWIGYNDFARWSHSGIALLDRPDEKLPPAPRPNVPVVRRTPTVLLRGGGVMQQLQITDNEHYETLPIAVTHRSTYYETKSAFAIGDKMRFVSSPLPHYGYIYILGVDANEKAALHFPQPGQSAYVADDNARLVFPHSRPDYDQNGALVQVEQGFNKDVNGSDWLVVLYSKQAISPARLSAWTETLTVPSGQVMPTLERILGKEMIPWRSVKFDPQAMRFTVGSGPGSIVPLVLKINGY